MYTYLYYNVYFKYLPILPGNHRWKNWKKNPRISILFISYYRYFSHYSWYVKGFFKFNIITNGIPLIFRKGGNLGNYLENPLILRIYKEIQEWLSHLSKLIKLDAKVAIESTFPRFKWIFTELPSKWKYLLCSAKLDSYLFQRTDHIPPCILVQLA